MSASIAYFSFLSLFPLILGVIAAGSLFLDSVEVRDRLDQLLVAALPGSADFVRENIDALIRLRGAAGVASIVVLMWSARKMVGAMSRAINQALDLKRPHAFYLSPLRNFGLTITVPILLFFSMALSTTAELLIRTDLGLPGSALENFLKFASSHAASFLLSFFILVAVYRLIPYKAPAWRDIVPGALLAGLLFELGKAAFVVYIDNASRFEAVYGPVSSVIVLLLWLYFSARVLLYGAEVIAVKQEKS